MVDITKITTIKVDRETKSRLDKLKVHPKESYDEIIQKILYVLNLCKANPQEARNRLIAIDNVKKLSEIKIQKNDVHFLDDRRTDIKKHDRHQKKI